VAGARSIAENVAVYEIAEPSPLPARPNLPGTVVLRATPDEAIDAAAADFLIHAVNCVRSFGDFHLAIATDAGVEPLLRRLMYDPSSRDLPWSRVHLWLLDELICPDGSASDRATALDELVVQPSGIPSNQVHAINTSEQSPEDAYEAQIREHLGWREKGHDRLDCVLFGVDDHFSSFIRNKGPGVNSTPADRLVATIQDGSERRRVTMTARLVDAARLIGVVALGEQCRPILTVAIARDATMMHPHDPRQILFANKAPLGGELRWYLDSAACPGAGGLKS